MCATEVQDVRVASERVLLFSTDLYRILKMAALLSTGITRCRKLVRIATVPANVPVAAGAV